MKTKGRQSNLELLRIICMAMIISGHVLAQTAAQNLTYKDGIDYYLILFMSTGVRWGINCFVMIGAWFLVDLPFKAKRIVDLWLEIFFYAVLLCTICLIFRVGDYSIVYEIQALFPIMGRPIWFGAEYLLMLILSPFMNEMLKNNQTICVKLLCIMFIFIVGCSTVFPIDRTMPMFSELLWFLFLYLFVGYVKLYRIELVTNRKIAIASGVLSLVLYIVFVCVRGFVYAFDIRFLINIIGFYFVHYENVIAFVWAWSMFVFFANLKMGCKTVINVISNSVLAVYLIHQSWALTPFLWNGIYDVDNIVSSGCFSIYLIWIIISLFAVAIGADYIRERMLMKHVRKTKLYIRVCNKIEDFLII